MESMLFMRLLLIRLPRRARGRETAIWRAARIPPGFIVVIEGSGSAGWGSWQRWARQLTPYWEVTGRPTGIAQKQTHHANARTPLF